MGGSVLSRVFATILSRSEHCTAAFFAQGAKNYTDVKLDLLYRLILWTYIIFVRKNNFLSPSVYCPDTSKRVPRIVTATETEWRNRFVRDWIQTKRAKNHDTLRDLKITSQASIWHRFRLLILTRLASLEPFSPETQATNGHFQNYQKWSMFNENYQNRRTSIFWLLVLLTKIDTACFQMFGSGWGTNDAGCWLHDGDDAVSNTE